MSTLNVDALVGNTSANAITVRGEGSATTSLQQGLAKAWVNFTGVSTTAARDSFNVGSLTDISTGKQVWFILMLWQMVIMQAHITLVLVQVVILMLLIMLTQVLLVLVQTREQQH